MFNEKIPVIAVWSDNFEKLRNIFLQSIDTNKIELLEKKIDLGKHTEFGFQSAAWREAVIIKMDFLLDCLNQYPFPVFLCSDYDIQIFNTQLLFEEYRKFAQSDIMFMGCREPNTKNDFNGGFYFIKNSREIINFFVEALNYIKKHKLPLSEQDFINQNKTKIKHKFFGNEFACMGDRKITLNTCLHHAIDTNNEIEKIKQLKEKYKIYFCQFYNDNPVRIGKKYGYISKNSYDGIQLENINLYNPFIKVKA